MDHIVATFDSFREAAEFARHTAKYRRVELGLRRADQHWRVIADSPLADVAADEMEARLREKDDEAAVLRGTMAELQRRLSHVEAEKEEFRRRVIKHEAKTPSAVAESFTQSHYRRPLAESTCEACGRTLTFCICAG